MAKLRRKFDSEYKLKVVAVIATGDTKLTSEAREYGIPPTVIKYWQKQLAKGTLRESRNSRKPDLGKQVQDFKPKIDDLVIGIDTLKK